MSELPLQRRFERQVVRLQARLEGGVGDRWIPWTATAALAFVLVWTSLARVESLKTGIDLAGYSQALWLLGQGKMPQASLFGTEVHLLELHWSFILYPLGLLGLAFPPAKLLVVTQGLALAIGVLPLWWLARQVANLRVGAATALTMAYALHPVTHRLGTEDFHPEALAVPAIIGMAYFGATKRWIWYWMSIAVILACRADLGLAVALWGFVVLGHRERSVGVWTLGVGLVWSLGLLLVVQPIVGDTGVIAGRFGYDGTSLGEVVLSSMRDPVSLVQDLLARENITLVVGLLAPLIFLPLLSLRYLAPALPLGVIYLIADLPADAAFAERSSMLLAFMMIAATYALNRLGNMGVDRVFLDVRVLTTLAAASVLLFVASSPISPYERPWTWDELDETDRAAVAALDRLGPDIAVRASPSTLALLSERPWLFSLDPSREPSAAQAGFPDFTRAVLVVEREIPERSDVEREEFDRAMVNQGFELIVDDRDDGVALYSREGFSAATGG
ncbi:MAG: DUF2079 domain-containing protein [Acidimicrobiia bacterium]|nr:DUF2079 domain-containing protein [Acidimicrobiia bacterium]